MSARPCTVGLTGGLASGKSTAARLLERRGAALLDADALVHELYRPGGGGAEAVAALFGEAVLAGDGGVDRSRLAARVLDDPAALARLNAAVHPLVRAGVARWLEELGRRETVPEVAVVEAALLVETGAADAYDLLVVVWCRPEQQLERALVRGVPRERAEALLAAQLPLETKCERAEVLIDNSGPPEALAGEVDRAWQEIVSRCRRRGGGGPESEDPKIEDRRSKIRRSGRVGRSG